MPTNINPSAAPKLPDETKSPYDDEPKALPLRGLMPPDEPPPDVSSWVRKANVRLEPAWAENEVRCGRVFKMPGATIFEGRELAAVFSTYDTQVHIERGCVIVCFKPRRGVRQPGQLR